MFARLNIVLAGLLAVVVALAATSSVDYSRPNVEFLPEMKYSPAWSSFEPNPHFANGRTLQAPPAGTIARGEMPLCYEATKEDAVRAGDELVNPFTAVAEPLPDASHGEKAVDAQGAAQQSKREAAAAARLKASVNRGGEVYRIFCVSCHGAGGAGDGPVAQRGFPPPPSLLTGKSPKMKDGQLFHILTYGQGSMSPFAAQLSPAQRWDAVNYLRHMQGHRAVQTNDPASGRRQPARGRDE